MLIFLLGSYLLYKNLTNTSKEARYVTGKVERGTIIASISGTGQVSGVNQIELKPMVSGDIIYVGPINGTKVSIGTLIAEINTKDAEKSVRDAEASLLSSQLALKKLKIQNSDENLDSDAIKVYDDGFNTVSNAFSDLQEVLTGLQDILAQNNLSDNSARINGKIAETYREEADTAYSKADDSFNTTRKNYRTLTNNSPKSNIENVIKETYDTTKLVSGAIKNSVNFVDFMADEANDSSSFTAAQNSLATYTNTTNGHLTDLLVAQKNIKDNKDSTENSALDIQSSELSVTEKQNALQDAKDKLADYFIRAPFSGTITNFDVKKSDFVSSSTVIATLITDKQLAEISLNEVDVAKVEIGQKATLTFDAIPELTTSGIVSEIDSIGLVSQGVVSYTVKITLDIQDARIKSGMTANANIQTEVKKNVLYVPSSAVKTLYGRSYVQVFSTPFIDNGGNQGTTSTILPEQVEVETGISDDTNIEIISGLTEGGQIVTRTISGGNVSKSTPPTTSNPRAGGANVIRF